MFKMSAVFTCVLLLWAPSVLSANDQAARTDQEVQYLLEFIEESGCTFIRNGVSHDSSTARKHINKKYQHIRKRMGSAEDFVTYAASKSSITGTRYKVKCGSRTMPSDDWLNKELRHYRESREQVSRSIE